MEAEKDAHLDEGAPEELSTTYFDALSTSVLEDNAARVEKQWELNSGKELTKTSALVHLSFTGAELGSSKEVDLSNLVSSESSKTILKRIRLLSSSNSGRSPIALHLTGENANKYPGACAIAAGPERRGDPVDHALYVANMGNTQGPIDVFEHDGADTAVLWNRYRQLIAMEAPFSGGQQQHALRTVSYVSPTCGTMDERKAVEAAHGIRAAPQEVSADNGDVLAHLMWSNRGAFRHPVTACKERALSADEAGAKPRNVVALKMDHEDWGRLCDTVSDMVIDPLNHEITDLGSSESATLKFRAEPLGPSGSAEDQFHCLLGFEFENV